MSNKIEVFLEQTPSKIEIEKEVLFLERLLETVKDSSERKLIEEEINFLKDEYKNVLESKTNILNG